MLFDHLPIEMLVEVAFQGAPNIFAFLLLVRTSTTSSTWHAAIAAARLRVVERLNADLLLAPAYLFGEYGPPNARTKIGIESVPIDTSKKLSFRVHATDSDLVYSLRVIVVLKVSMVFRTPAGYDSTFELDLALRFYGEKESAFNLCGALGWPNGTVQAEHMRAEADRGYGIRALKKTQFDRHPDNQPQILHIDWCNDLTKMVVTSAPLEMVVAGEPRVINEYTARLRRSRHLTVCVMRAVKDSHDYTSFRGRSFDPAPHLWLRIEGILPLKAYSFDEYEDLTFETDGLFDGKASGLTLMKAFGYKEHLAVHREEVRRCKRAARMRVFATKEVGRGSKRTAAASAAVKVNEQLCTFRLGERQDEDSEEEEASSEEEDDEEDDEVEEDDEEEDEDEEDEVDEDEEDEEEQKEEEQKEEDEEDEKEVGDYFD